MLAPKAGKLGSVSSLLHCTGQPHWLTCFLCPELQLLPGLCIRLGEAPVFPVGFTVEGWTFPNLVQQRAAAGKPQQRSLVKKNKIKKKSLISESLLMADSAKLPREEECCQRAMGDMQHNRGADALLAPLVPYLLVIYIHVYIHRHIW